MGVAPWHCKNIVVHCYLKIYNNGFEMMKNFTQKSVKYVKTGFFLGLLSLSVTLGACTPTYEPAFKSGPMGEQIYRDVSFYSYVASDKIIRQLRGEVTDETPILIGTFSNIDKLETTNTLGRTVTEHVSTRFVQRGFSVTEMKMRQSVNIQNTTYGNAASGEFLMSRDVRAVSGEHKAAAIVTGTYAVASTDVLINLRVMDVETGKVLASTDYTLPRNDDVNALLGDDAATSFFDGPLRY